MKINYEKVMIFYLQFTPLPPRAKFDSLSYGMLKPFPLQSLSRHPSATALRFAAAATTASPVTVYAPRCTRVRAYHRG